MKQYHESKVTSHSQAKYLEGIAKKIVHTFSIRKKVVETIRQ